MQPARRIQSTCSGRYYTNLIAVLSRFGWEERAFMSGSLYGGRYDPLRGRHVRPACKHDPHDMRKRSSGVQTRSSFVARDDADGTELWESDGTAAGTVVVK